MTPSLDAVGAMFATPPRYVAIGGTDSSTMYLPSSDLTTVAAARPVPRDWRIRQTHSG